MYFFQQVLGQGVIIESGIKAQLSFPKQCSQNDYAVILEQCCMTSSSKKICYSLVAGSSRLLSRLQYHEEWSSPNIVFRRFAVIS